MVALNVRQAAAEHTYIPTHSDSSLLILDAECHPIWEQSRTQCSGIRRWDHGGAQHVRHAPTKFRGDAAPFTWLFGIAKNKCAQAFRNRSRRQAMAQAFVVDIRHHAHAEEPEMPEHVMVERAQLTRLAASLTALRDDERILLNL